ncbi:MAG: hypothetical protein ACI9YL_000395 [Luteibaculaceae bacterium]|jgi:hypothetical protein
MLHGQWINVGVSQGGLLVHRQTMEALYNDFQKNIHIVFINEIDPYQVQNREKFAFRLEFLASDLGNPEKLGKGYALIPGVFLQGKGDRVSTYFEAGAGLGYVDKKFDPVDNHKNIAIGSHWNAAIRIGGGLNIKLGEKLAFKPGFQVLHFSNGSVKIPNKGLNFLGYQVSLSYQISDRLGEGLGRFYEDSKELGFRINYYIGIKEAIPYGGGSFVTHSIGMDRVWEKEKVFWDLGLDYFYNRSLLAEGVARDVKVAESDLSRMGIHFGGEPKFGRFRLQIQGGFYFMDALNFHGAFYNRIAWIFQGNFLDVRLGLKSHFAKADHLEFGISKRW